MEMKDHSIGGGQKQWRGNRIWPHKPNPNAHKPVVRKIPVDSVLHGRDITHREYLWGAFDDETLICWAATAPEARAKYYPAKALAASLAQTK